MKLLQTLAYGCILLLLSFNALATKTKFDPTIFERDLIAAGIVDIERVKSDLRLNENTAVSVRHVVTTARDQANQQRVFLDIKTLEHISPKLHTAPMLKKGRQVALSEAQIRSICRHMQKHKQQVPAWLEDKSQKKYVQVVLVEAKHHKRTSALSTQDAKLLAEWAVKHKHIYAEDHPNKHHPKHKHKDEHKDKDDHKEPEKNKAEQKQ